MAAEERGHRGRAAVEMHRGEAHPVTSSSMTTCECGTAIRPLSLTRMVSGLALAASTRSLRDFHGLSVWTARVIGVRWCIAIGWKLARV